MRDEQTYCCDAMAQAVKRWDTIVGRGEAFVVRGGELESNDAPAIRMVKHTKAGNVSKRGTAIAYIRYCPFCGRKLRFDAAEEVPRERA